GDYHTCAVGLDGSLWCWGNDNYGQLGDGGTVYKDNPNLIDATGSWASVTGGTNHTCGIRKDGTLWCFGASTYGQLGLGAVTQATTPAQVGAATDWTVLAGGSYHTCGIRAATGGRTLWCWGYNTDGELGNGSTTESTVPVQVGVATDWATVAAGAQHTCGIRDDGATRTLWCWGYDAYGQLGDYTTGTKLTPTRLGTFTDVAAVAVLDASTCLSRQDGSTWCTGDNGYGQLATGTPDRQIAPVSIIGGVSDFASLSGRNATLCGVRTSDAKGWCWGYNGSSEVGDGTSTNRPNPVQVSVAATDVDECAQHASNCDTNASCYNTAGGFTCTCNPGYAGNGVSCAAVPFSVTKLAAGPSHTCAVVADHSLWCWGAGSSGQLGDWNNASAASPTRVGSETTWASVATGASHTCAVKLDGSLWCFGDDGNSQLGDGQNVAKQTPNLIAAGTTWSTIAAGNAQTCGIKPDQTLWCWGYNGYGQLGVGNTQNQATPTQVGTASDWSYVSPGSYHTCGLRSSAGASTLWCWGYDADGELGNGSTTQSPVPVQVGVATDWVTVKAGTYHTCGIRSSSGQRTVWCWGDNVDGEIGDFTTVSRTQPTQVGAFANVADVVVMDYSTCITLQDGSAYCWGDNTYGQLGTGLPDRLTSPAPMVAATPMLVSLYGQGVRACGLRSDGTAWCWGSNANGQLGDGTTTNRPGPVQVGKAPTDIDECALHAANCSASAACYNTIGSYTCTCNQGYAGDGFNCSPVSWSWLALDEGKYHTCGILTDHSLWCWGYGGNGQIGNFGNGSPTTPTRVGRDLDWAAVATGFTHTCAIKLNGSLWCWGDGGYGEMGDGSTVSRNFPNVIGTARDWAS
ncbi:MAG TPA: EGF domain-containing protein, partial [Acidimicrobiales bacterium]|nr:EGF domain-containing protein [Acidimicrobiales bacterium]